MIEVTDFIVKALVREPDMVTVEEGNRRGEDVLRIVVAEGDRGTVIGRQGRTIRAIETVLEVVSAGRGVPGLDVTTE